MSALQSAGLPLRLQAAKEPLVAKHAIDRAIVDLVIDEPSRLRNRCQHRSCPITHVKVSILGIGWPLPCFGCTRSSLAQLDLIAPCLEFFDQNLVWRQQDGSVQHLLSLVAFPQLQLSKLIAHVRDQSLGFLLADWLSPLPKVARGAIVAASLFCMVCVFDYFEAQIRLWANLPDRAEIAQQIFPDFGDLVFMRRCPGSRSRTLRPI